MPPLGLYVHLPWCVRKCPYCDFNSHTAGDAAPTTRYVQALLADIEAEADRARGRTLQTVFLGGGTPSLFSAREIGVVLGAIRDCFELTPRAEITMEANPGTVECGEPAGYRDAGVNRFSLGAQSFDDGALRTLGRIHTAADIARAVSEARAGGFDNLNIDLMFALPGQDVAGAIADIEHAAALEPSHISWYQLTLEPNTVFHARPPADLPGDDQLADIEQQGALRLNELGFEQYEVSAWSRGGRRCLHNLNYWQFGDYLAVGAGAHGKITDERGVWRYVKPVNPLSYMQAAESGAPAVPMNRIEGDELVFEFMLNALRLRDGFRERDFERRTGLAAECLQSRVESLRERGLLEPIEPSGWRPTTVGRRFLNDLQTAFLPE